MTIIIIIGVLLAAIAVLIIIMRKQRVEIKQQQRMINAFKRNLNVLKQGTANKLKAQSHLLAVREQMKVAKSDEEIDVIVDDVVSTLVDGVRNMPNFD